MNEMLRPLERTLEVPIVGRVDNEPLGLLV